MSEHKVKVWLTRTSTGTPHKWSGQCKCGWGCLSWSWSRSLEAAGRERYVEENGEPVGGALVMALEHVGLLPADCGGIYPPLPPRPETWGDGCECWVTPEHQHYVYCGITEPGSAIEFNPGCPKHGYREEGQG